MIYSITGTIVQLTEGTLCIDNSGIVWEIAISQKSYEMFAPHLASEETTEAYKARVYTWLHVFEKGMSLYGFYTLAERSVFLTLLKVDGIGPKAALKILSQSTPELLVSRIKSHDTTYLTTLPGVGARKASKMLLALEDVYISSRDIGKNTVSLDNIDRANGMPQDLFEGLVKMGYKAQDVERAFVSVRGAESSDEGSVMRDIIVYIENNVG